MTQYKLIYFTQYKRQSVKISQYLIYLLVKIEILSELVRLIFAASGEQYEDFRFEREKWPALKATMCMKMVMFTHFHIFVDIFFMNVLERLGDKNQDVLKNFQALKKHNEMLRALPNIAKWLESRPVTAM